MLLRDLSSLPRLITSFDINSATYISEKLRRLPKKLRIVSPKCYTCYSDFRAKSAGDAHAVSLLMGSQCSNDETEFQILNNEIKC